MDPRDTTSLQCPRRRPSLRKRNSCCNSLSVWLLDRVVPPRLSPLSLAVLLLLCISCTTTTTTTATTLVSAFATSQRMAAPTTSSSMHLKQATFLLHSLNNSNHNHSNNHKSPFDLADLPAAVGESALQQVQWLGSRVAQKEEDSYSTIKSRIQQQQQQQQKVQGTGGSVMSQQKRQILDYQSRMAETKSSFFNAGDGDNYELMNQSNRANAHRIYHKNDPDKERAVWDALVNLEQGMQMLDRMAGQRPQLSRLELSLLTGAVLAAAGGPVVVGGAMSEVLAPSMAAFIAAICIGAEYTGKVAVADGKEVAAVTIQCAAEAEGFLAQAERAKAVTPLCVGIATTAATLALLVPVLLDSLASLPAAVNLFCPLVSILAAAVASLAFEETKSYCRQAVGVGNRRFARSGLVGRSWMSSTEQIGRKSTGAATKWKRFSFAVLPAPVLGSLVPGALATKTIVVAALAAAQSAYFLSRAESCLSRATDAVALKARSAAVCDTYANQGARSSAILPFTSALSGLCAAATAAIVELPFLEALAVTSSSTSTTSAWAPMAAMMAQIGIVAAFPALSALFAAAASVSKARCQVDAEAAMQAASTLALAYDDEENDPVLRPLAGVAELIRLTVNTTVREPARRFWRFLCNSVRRRRRRSWFRRRRRRNDVDSSAAALPP